MTKKERILKAMRGILQEYKEKTHETSVTTCKLCRIFFVEENNWMQENNYHTCHKCPMFVFHKDDDEYSCMERKCVPIYCEENQRLTISLKKVIEFYERVIAKVESMTKDELQKPRAWNFLLEIDNEVSEKYKVVRKKA